MPGTLIQIQQVKQDAEGEILEREFVAQREVKDTEDIAIFRSEVEERHPLKEGMKWFTCGQNSKHFIPTEA